MPPASDPPRPLGLPIIDISALLTPDPEPEALAAAITAIGLACRDWGFFYVAETGIDPAVIAKWKVVAKEFFGKSTELKRGIARNELNHLGYEDAEYSDLKLDGREFLDYRSDQGTVEGDGNARSQWPEGMPEFRKFMSDWYELQLNICSKVMKAIFSTLDISPEEAASFFDPTHDTCYCRLSYYPRVQSTELLGAHPHTDGAAIALILQDDGISSLQVLRNGEVYDVVPIPGTFVVNLGEMVQVWSNDAYLPAVHQVLSNKEHERLSSTFLFSPSKHAKVEPLRTCVSEESPSKHKPMNIGEFYQNHHYRSFAGEAKALGIEDY